MIISAGTLDVFSRATRYYMGLYNDVHFCLVHCPSENDFGLSKLFCLGPNHFGQIQIVKFYNFSFFQSSTYLLSKPGIEGSRLMQLLGLGKAKNRIWQIRSNKIK